jgi:peptidyl-prolyl cis-trans isomerase SurA
VKKYKSWLVAALILIVQPLHAEVVDRIVAVVNEEIITLSDWNTAFEPYRKRIEETYKGPDKERVLTDSRKSFLNRLIDARLIEQQAKRNGISVREEDVMTAIKDILGRRNIALEDFKKELAEEGVSFDTYKKEIKEQMVKMRLVRREIKSKVMVTGEEIGDYYRKNRADYEGKEAVRIKQIFLALPRGADEEAKEKIKADAEDISRRLKNGEAFELLAANYSRGSAGDGDLGFIERGVSLPEVESAAFSLQKDAVSDIIQSRAGFHIIKVVDKKGGGITPIETVREEIRNKIEEQKLEKKFEEWLDALRKKSHIEIKS